MLHVSKEHTLSAFEPEPPPPPSPSLAEYVQVALGFGRRQWWVIVVALVAAASAAASYLFLAPANYKATATVVIDTAKFQLFQPMGELSIESSSAVESQLEIMKSEKITLEVIKKLHLADDIPPPPRRLLGWLLGPSKAPTEFEYTRQLVAILQKHLTVKRLGAAWIIEISYDSTDPERAAEFANAFADTYIADLLDAKYQSTRQASAWLEGRVQQAREQTIAAQQAVVEFKAKNNIVDTGGRLMNDQELAEVNSQLLTARGKVSEAKAQLDRVNAVVKSALAADNSNPLVTDVPVNETIAKLRTQLMDLTSKERDWTARFGANHYAVINLHLQIVQVRSAMLDEFRHVGETFKGDYDLTLQKEKNLEAQVAQAVSQTEATSRAQVKLRQLESTAASTKELYDNLNKRYLESLEEKSSPVTDARVITRAVRPLDQEYKSTLKIIAAIFGGGMSLGIALAVLRELSDNTFRKVSQVERQLQMNCITTVPLWKESTSTSQPHQGSGGARLIARTGGPAWVGIDCPLSSYAESLRSVKLAIDLGSPGRGTHVVGLTSSLPREGKSTIAASLALAMAAAGAKVLLLDFDLRNPTLTRMLAPKSKMGFIEVLTGKSPLSNALLYDQTKNLAFLPTATEGLFIQSNEVLGAQVTKTFLDRLRNEYAYIIVDLPPLAPVIDTKATTHLIDSYLFVVEWGMTKTDVIKHALSRAPGVSEKILGVVLNKVNMEELHKYDTETRSYYVNKHYSQYGYTH